jgi:hypothetical protein
MTAHSESGRYTYSTGVLPATHLVQCIACQPAGPQSRGVPRVERKEGATCGDLRRSATCLVSTVTVDPLAKPNAVLV